MKQLDRTKVTVRIRKAEFRNEWYLNIESYPVFVQGQKKPERIVEALNRTISTIIWDKKRTARTTKTSKTYKPQRDEMLHCLWLTRHAWAYALTKAESSTQSGMEYLF